MMKQNLPSAFKDIISEADFDLLPLNSTTTYSTTSMNDSGSSPSSVATDSELRYDSSIDFVDSLGFEFEPNSEECGVLHGEIQVLYLTDSESVDSGILDICCCYDLPVSSSASYTVMPTSTGKLSEVEKNAAHIHACRALVAVFTGEFDLKDHSSLLHKLTGVIPVEEMTSWQSRFKELHILIDDLKAREENASEESHLDFYKRYLGTTSDKKLNHRYCMKQHNLGRYHAGKAVVFLLLTSCLYSTLSDDEINAAILEFKVTFTTNIIPCLDLVNLSRFLRVYPFLQCMQKLLPIPGNVEIYLLVASCVSGEGIYHQRSGRNLGLLDICYRYLIEYISDPTLAKAPSKIRTFFSQDRSTTSKKSPHSSPSLPSFSDPDDEPPAKKRRSK